MCLDVSEASDWWSVGSLMYELLIGRVSVLAWTSSFVVQITVMYRLTQSTHLCSGLPFLLLQGGTISSVCLPTYSCSRLFKSRFPAPFCDVLHLHSLPGVIISHVSL